MAGMQWVRRGSLGVALSGCCAYGEDTCTGSDDPHVETFDCEQVAIQRPDGTPDVCDLAACESCVDTCGGDCMVLESYPPQYSCGAEGSWSAYEECPDWTPPNQPEPRAKRIVDHGCGTDPGESLTAAADGPSKVAVTHVDAVVGCCPTEIQVDVVAHPDATLAVSYTLVGDDCDCACALDVSYDIAPVTSGSWTVVAPSGATAPVSVP